MPFDFLFQASTYYQSPKLNTWSLAFVSIILLGVIINSTSAGPNVGPLQHSWLGLTILQLSAIPAFGPRGRLTSYIGSYFFLRNTSGVLQKEIDHRRGEMFRVPFLDHWEVVVTSKKIINELAQAHDNDLSAIDAVADVLQTEFTMGPSIKYDQYHVGVIGSTMTRNLVARFDDVYDEIACSCEDVIRDRIKGDCKVTELHSSRSVTNSTFFL